MDIIEAIRARKSIRDFKPDPIPQEILKEILSISTRAPSGMNTQPWEITVLTGKVLEKVKKGNLEMLAAGVFTQALSGQHFEGKYRERQTDLAIRLFNLMGITREDKEKRAEWLQRGFYYFNAQAAFILSIDCSLAEPMAAFGIGALAQTICLTAMNYGLGTCIEVQGVMFPEVLRQFAGLPESKRPIVSIAIGYPNWDFPANRLVSPREPLENVVTWRCH
jgi:nitroreductase